MDHPEAINAASNLCCGVPHTRIVLKDIPIQLIPSNLPVRSVVKSKDSVRFEYDNGSRLTIDGLLPF